VERVSGVPVEYLSYQAFIRRRPKNSMQSGTHNTHTWILTFEPKQGWENPLIGYHST
jgi:hypothetical protein